MNRNTQFPTMPCYCANQPRGRSVPRSDTSDTEECDHLKQGFPRSDYSGRSSQKYESGSMLDDQAWNALSSLRQKACRFITSETEQPQTDSLVTHCPCDRGYRYGGANVLRKANDLIDYTPQSEFLKRMKQQCQLLCNNQDNIFSALNEGFINNTYDNQMSNRSQRMGEHPQGSTGVRFDDLLYQNSSYDPPCSADEKLLDSLIDRKVPSEQSIGRPKSANKKSQHISRSKKPSKCRGRRKRKSGSSEKCESEDQFEPTLKRPHENSCERCWRYASPARSPVNKPDQKYDPNFRRGHSCYDFEGGDGEFYDRRKSPYKNLQPITSREKQEQQQQQQQQSPSAKVLEARPLSGTWKRSPDDQPRSLSRDRQRSPDAQPRAASPIWQQSPETQPQTYSSTRQRPPEVQSQTFTTTWHQSVEPQPQTYTSTWHRSPEAQPLTFPSEWSRCPEAPPQTFNATWPRCPETQPQTFNNTWPRYPEAQPQTFTSKWPRSPEAQPQTFTSKWPRSPEAQPQTFTSKWPRSPEPQLWQSPQERTQLQFRDQSPVSPQENDCRYHPMKSPERSVPIPQSFTHPSQSPVSQGVMYPESVQVPGPENCIPGDFYSAEIKRYSDGIDDLDITEYQSICPGPKEEFHEPTNASLSARSLGSTNLSSVGEKVYSPRHPSPPRPCPKSLGTIPEAADSDSCKCKSSQQNRSGSPQTVKAKSPKILARQGTPKTDSTAQSNATPSPNKTSKSPNKSTSRSSPNKSTSGSSPNKTAIGSSPNKSSSGSSRNKSTRSGGSPNKSSKSPNRSGNGSTKKCRPKSPSPKPGSSKLETKSPKKSPQKSPKAEAKKIKSLDDVSGTKSRTPEQRPQSSDPRREVSFRRDQVQASVRVEPPDQYLGLDHGIKKCVCGPESSFSRGVNSDKHTVCCHCNWYNCPSPSKSSPRASEIKRLSPQPNAELNDRQLIESSVRNSPRGNTSSENQAQIYKGFDGRIFECPHRKRINISAEQPLSNTVNSSFERDCRLLSELQNTPSFQSSLQDLSPIQGSPRKYFMFYMTKCKENRGDDDVEVLVEELTQTCPNKTDSRTKDLRDKMKKIMECPSDSMALRFQKGVSDQCKIPQSSRVLYF